MTVSFDSVSWMVCANAGTENAADSIRPVETRTTARRIMVRSIKSSPRVVVDKDAGRRQRPKGVNNVRRCCLDRRARDGRAVRRFSWQDRDQFKKGRK